LVLALGGASWSKTGSDGKWVKTLNNFGIKTLDFEPSNCGLEIPFSTVFIQNHEGKPLKNIRVTVGNKSKKGEVVITNYGLEGNAIYPISSTARTLLKEKKNAFLYLDFKPNNTTEEIYLKIKNKNVKTYRNTLNLNTVEMALLKQFTSKEQFLDPLLFAQAIKKLAIPIAQLRPVEEAISVVGGIPTEELNTNYSLKKQKNIFAIGEMTNWDAPTGGFLLQACFSMGAYTAQSIHLDVTEHQ